MKASVSSKSDAVDGKKHPTKCGGNGGDGQVDQIGPKYSFQREFTRHFSQNYLRLVSVVQQKQRVDLQRVIYSTKNLSRGIFKQMFLTNMDGENMYGFLV